MIDKIKHFWKKGGYTIVLLIVALAIYLVGMDFATSCYQDANAPVEMTIDSEGKLGIHYVYDDFDEVHVLWETDGGNITPVKDNDNFKDQYTEENNGYFCYTNVLEQVKWSPEDNDGNKYTTANIRALVYEETDEKTIYCLEGHFIEVYMTVTINENGKVVKADNRYFTSPIREGGDKDWSQVYPIFEGEDGKVTYRYRTGNDLDGEKEIYARWQCNEAVLCETYILGGYIPGFQVVEATSNLKVLTQLNAVTVDTSKLDSGKDYILEAFLVEGDHYDDADLAEEFKIHRAEYEIEIAE